jgi:tRNA (guanine26-N2/guanine27-N2)-dimethyltransferase
MSQTLHEGSVRLTFGPLGKDRGPARRMPVFYNPAMRFNRDVTVCVLQTLSDERSLPGKGGTKVMDGLCGTGIRGIRFMKEVDWGGTDVEVHAVDNNPKAIEAGEALAAANSADVVFHRGSLPAHLHEHRYSFIDIDPYGSPLPFLPSAVSSILPGGVIAVTATDTAALCGSNRRVALRRYGVELVLTEFMKEVSCRVLAGTAARTAASMDLYIVPLLFFASDHYVRGFFRVLKGARKADEMVSTMGMVGYRPPQAPVPFAPEGSGERLGPMWLGPLEDLGFLAGMERALAKDRGISEHIGSLKQLTGMIALAAGESALPPFGFDTDVVASHLAASPPRMDRLIEALMGRGLSGARSRFGGKILRTEAALEDISPFFKGGG